MNNKLNRYFTRTVQHIHRVQNNMVTIVTEFRENLGLPDEVCRQLMHNVMNHDRSKFSNFQFIPYVELTEYYHQRKVLGNKDYQYPTKEMEEWVDKAVVNHYHTENHHPEKFAGIIGKWDFYEAVECVCDLQAMAQEFNEGTCRKYFEEIWKPKQSKNFSDDFNWIEVTTWMDAVIKCFEALASRE